MNLVNEDNFIFPIISYLQLMLKTLINHTKHKHKLKEHYSSVMQTTHSETDLARVDPGKIGCLFKIPSHKSI